MLLSNRSTPDSASPSLYIRQGNESITHRFTTPNFGPQAHLHSAYSITLHCDESLPFCKMRDIYAVYTNLRSKTDSRDRTIIQLCILFKEPTTPCYFGQFSYLKIGPLNFGCRDMPYLYSPSRPEISQKRSARPKFGQSGLGLNFQSLYEFWNLN